MSGPGATPPPRASRDDDLPERIAEYRVLRELGAGAMGRVVLAERDGHRYALKLLHPHLLTARGFFRRFRREARAGCAIAHRNVVRTHECDLVMVAGRPLAFLAMDYVEGRTLRDLLRAEGAVPEERAVGVTVQVAEGLAAVHAQGVVHRDLKPENLLMGDDGIVRISDLGVARLSAVARRLTGEGQLAGSMAYASPEQLRGHDTGPASDLYSLGIVLFELLCGLNPFLCTHPADVIDAHLSRGAPALRSRAPHVSRFVGGVVDRLLAGDARDRFASAEQLAATLRHGTASAW